MPPWGGVSDRTQLVRQPLRKPIPDQPDPPPTKRCYVCGEDPRLDTYPKRRGSPDGYDNRCRKCYNDAHARYSKAARLRSPATQMLNAARARAKAGGYPFNLTIEDILIPSHCPVLGVPLVAGVGVFGPASPSLDKILPELGYVRGNIQVISWRANAIKGDATMAELRAVASYFTASTSARVTRGRPKKGTP